MTIKELEELKEYAATKLHGHANEDDPLETTYTEQDQQILGLIDAEIERQSVTDEEISEAIEYFKRLKIYAVEFEKEFPEMPQALDMADLAIKALEAYRPERGEHPVGDIRYFAVTTEDGEILGYFDLVSNEAVRKKGILTRIGYGEPTFIDRDGVVYLGGSEKSE